MTSTRDHTLIAGVAWQNAGAGARGSIADGVMRKGLAEAARDIADELAARLKPAT
ncbi:MAG TPA: hypothetical protein VNR11_00075 [Xanthobacteraceae bacterium]|nr:hypothetical protein [Xanthobacteraceae bacterium]